MYVAEAGFSRNVPEVGLRPATVALKQGGHFRKYGYPWLRINTLNLLPETEMPFFNFYS